MDFSVKNILLSKNHAVSPFTIQKDFGDIKLSTLEKTASIGLSILIGSFTFLIGGIVAFYLITATIKSDKIKKLADNNPAPVPDPQPKPKYKDTKKRVHFSDETGGALEQVVVIKTPAVEEEPKQLPSLEKGLEEMFAHVSSPPNASQEYPSSVDHRIYPPRSFCDTVIFKDGALVGAHQEKKSFFQKEDILVLHQALPKDIDGFQAHLDDKNRIVIQQQALRGCTAAAVSMLIYPLCQKLDREYLRKTNLGDYRSMQQKMAEFQLHNHLTILPQGSYQSCNELLTLLKKKLEMHGSAVVSIGGEIGGHVVVLDEISENLQEVRLRDPYHGWAITVKGNAFFHRVGQETYALQIQKPTT